MENITVQYGRYDTLFSVRFNIVSTVQYNMNEIKLSVR